MQQNAWLDALPEVLSRQIRTASVPAHVKSLFSYLPHPVTLSAQLSESAPLPRGAAQLCKLSLGSTQLCVGEVRLATDQQKTRLSLSLHDRAVDLEDELNHDLSLLTKQALQALFSPVDLFGALEDFSFQSSTLATLQRITHQMLSAQDLERLSYLLLLGVTSGEALGFHRAIFFAYDEATELLTGSRAIGPSNAEEAHRIWEELEFEDATIEHLISETSQQRIDVRLQQMIAALSFSAKELPEVLAAVGPVLLSVESRPAGLAPLELSGPYVLAPVRARHKLLGVLFADHIVTAAPPSPQQQLLLGLFLEQTALLWENFLLLKRLEHLASYDGLTGVLTRREFDARLATELRLAHAEQNPCSLLLVDLDSFKQINDSQGHAAGDEVLRRVGVLLRRELRKHDLVGRFGGDEFVVFLPQVKPPELSMIASRILQSMHHEKIMTSIGGASFPRDCDHPEALFALADQNLYKAKHSGRGKLELGKLP